MNACAYHLARNKSNYQTLFKIFTETSVHFFMVIMHILDANS